MARQGATMTKLLEQVLSQGESSRHPNRPRRVPAYERAKASNAARSWLSAALRASMYRRRTSPGC